MSLVASIDARLSDIECALADLGRRDAAFAEECGACRRDAARRRATAHAQARGVMRRRSSDAQQQGRGSC
jgi:hypothetical protein